MLLNESSAGSLKQEPPQSSSTSLTPPSTPRHNIIGTSSHALWKEIQSIHEALKQCNSLAPSKMVNDLLTRLVTLCIAPYGDTTIFSFFSQPGSEDLCQSLRKICSEAEGALETFWVQRITAQAYRDKADISSSLLYEFPYHSNYLNLSRLEGALLDTYLPLSPSGITFIGSGPLPLSSLCLLDRYPDAKAWNIDLDAAALTHSKSLCDNLGYGDRMQYLCADIMEEAQGRDESWTYSSAILLAALVGTDTPAKISILSSLVRKLSSGTIILVRSARGMRSVLYPILEIDAAALHNVGLQVMAEVHPWDEVVNSVVVLKVL